MHTRDIKTDIKTVLTNRQKKGYDVWTPGSMTEVNLPAHLNFKTYYVFDIKIEYNANLSYAHSQTFNKKIQKELKSNKHHLYKN